jgi:uncharacterized protein
MDQDSVEKAQGGAPGEPVTAVIVRTVRPGKEAAFETWVKEIGEAQARFDGYQGATVIRPQGSGNAEYLVLVRFDDCAALARWRASREFNELIEKSMALADLRMHSVQTGMDTWFSVEGSPMPVPPPRYKMAITAGLAIFPLVLLLAYGLGWALVDLPLPVQILINTAILTPLMTWIAMPLLNRLLWPWLFPGMSRPPAAH